MPEGQITFEDLFRERMEQLKKPMTRMARATALLEFIERINYSNIKLGAIGGFGAPSYNFSFDEAYGARINKNGKYVPGKSMDQVAEDAARAAVQAEMAANRACEVCEYAEGCPRKGKLYEKLCSPDKVDVRRKIRARMERVLKMNGTQTMSCIKAAAIDRPTKKDWDF